MMLIVCFWGYSSSFNTANSSTEDDGETKKCPIGRGGSNGPCRNAAAHHLLEGHRLRRPQIGTSETLRALTSGLPTFITTPYSLRDCEVQTSHHNNHMGRKESGDFFEANY